MAYSRLCCEQFHVGPIVLFFLLYPWTEGSVHILRDKRLGKSNLMTSSSGGAVPSVSLFLLMPWCFLLHLDLVGRFRHETSYTMAVTSKTCHVTLRTIRLLSSPTCQKKNVYFRFELSLHRCKHSFSVQLWACRRKPSPLIFSNENTKYLLAICLDHHVLCLLLADGIRHYVFYIVRCVFIPSVEKKRRLQPSEEHSGERVFSWTCHMYERNAFR